MTSSPSNLPAPVIYGRDQHGISRKAIDPDALKIMYRLIRHGYKAYLVGGGVRDLLLKKVPKDFDIATDATPRKIKGLFRNSRIIGRRFKLVHVFFGGGKNIEVSTFRDFSDPIDPDDETTESKILPADDNKYGSEVTDALRRDLTINGLFYDLATFSVIDYVGGVTDLRNATIRVIGPANERFVEDPVRMIRAVRHAARSGFAIDAECADAIARNKKLIDSCPPMRIYEELKKDLTSGHLLGILRLLCTTGLLEYLLPALHELRTSLFDKSSFIPKHLAALDEAVKDGANFSAPVVLSALGLAVQLDSQAGASLGSAFNDEESVQGLIKSLFSEIAVPRREKEFITLLLDAVRLVHSEGFEDDAYLPGFNQSALEELLGLLRLVGAADSRQELVLEMISQGPRSRRPAARFAGGQGRGRGRGRRRRGGRPRR